MTQKMSPLRRRMIEDMTVRNLSPATERSYISAVLQFSRYFGRSPDQLELEDVRAFHVHLVSTGFRGRGSIRSCAPCASFTASRSARRALAIVPLLLDSGRAVRANLSLDAGLLDAIDEAAKAHGLTRSAFLASAAREKIEGRAAGSQGVVIAKPPARTPHSRHTNKRRA